MGFGFGALFKSVFPKKKEWERLSEKGHEKGDTREHIRRTTKAIKKVVKEPEDLPYYDNIPAIREILVNDSDSP